MIFRRKDNRQDMGKLFALIRTAEKDPKGTFEKFSGTRKAEYRKIAAEEFARKFGRGDYHVIVANQKSALNYLSRKGIKIVSAWPYCGGDSYGPVCVATRENGNNLVLLVNDARFY